MHFDATPQLLQQMSTSTLAYAKGVCASIDASLANPDSNYYKLHYQGYAAILTDALGGAEAYMNWYRHTFQEREENTLTWKERYTVVFDAVDFIDRHPDPQGRTFAINALKAT